MILGLSFIFIACQSVDDQNHPDFTTALEDTFSDTASSDTDSGFDTGSEDTGTPINTNQIQFQTFDVDCSRLALHSMSVTRIIPGELNPSPGNDPKQDLTASFLEEKARFSLGDASIELMPVVESDQPPYEEPKHCLFEISLEEPESWELNPLNGDESNSDLQWAFYYPALFAGETINCDDDNQTCTLTETNAVSEEPEFGTLDPQLASGDFYTWAGNVYIVYISGEIIGSFADMGFKQGWNLAQFEGNEIISVQSFSSEGSLMPIQIEIGDLLPRYSISIEGSKPGVDSSLTDGYSMGARPLPWLMGVDPSSFDSSASPINMRFQTTTYVPGADQAYQIALWGAPPQNHFFSADFDVDHDMYLQWADFVDVAPQIPVVYEGAPTLLDGGQAIPGDDIQYTNNTMGSLCIDSDRLSFLYYDTADRPSETLWYRLANAANLTTEIKPGWHAAFGTQGEPTTWRFVLENPSASGYDYNNTFIGSDCTAFPEWGN